MHWLVLSPPVLVQHQYLRGTPEEPPERLPSPWTSRTAPWILPSPHACPIAPPIVHSLLASATQVNIQKTFSPALGQDHFESPRACQVGQEVASTIQE